METSYRAGCDGGVESVAAQEGQQIAGGKALIKINPH